jgi:hypothetical protein
MKSILKKAAVIVIALVTVNVAVNAQTLFNKGNKVISAGAGLGWFYLGNNSSDISRLPFIAVYYEQCVKDNLFNEKGALGIGGMVGYTQESRVDFYKSNTAALGLRGSVHYGFINKLDTYAGLMLGYDIVNWKGYRLYGESPSNIYGDFTIGGYIGARYYFSDKIAAFAEGNIGSANVHIGIALKF